MLRKFSLLASVATAAGLVAAPLLPAQETKKESKSEARIEIRTGGGAPKISGKLTSPSETTGKIAAQSYWLGLQLDELNPVVREQLGLASGVSIVKVMPESPAAKAKLKPHDIIQAVGSQSINTPADMQKVLAACKGESLGFSILRGGSKSTVEVMPELSPEQLAGAVGGGGLEIGASTELSDNILGDVQELLKKFNQEGVDLDIDMFGPAIIVQSQSSSKMPEDLQIAITKNGNDPAKISVKQKDKSWDITEDKIDELPEELRPHVRAMLGNKLTVGDLKMELPGELGAKLKEKMAQAKERAASARDAAKERGALKSSEAELKRLEAEMKKLQEQLQKLQRGATSSLQSPSEQGQPQPGRIEGGAAAAAFSEGISISDGNGTRSQSRSGVKVSK